MNKMQIPPYLQTGDTIAIIAISKVVDEEFVTNASGIYQSWGLKVIIGPNVLSRHHRMAGTDKERLEDLQWALDHPEIKAVVFARGGYGATRIIDQADYLAFQQHPKWLCGFSDVTALLLKVQNLGVASMHAIMPAFYGWQGAEVAIESFRNALFGSGYHIPFEPNQHNKSGKGKGGQFTGGNLAMICNGLGTSSEIDTQGKILFLEDIDEYKYQIDRMMIQLKRAGKLQNLLGLIIGQFSSVKDNDDIPFGKTVEEIVLDHVGEYDYPVAFGAAIGHVGNNHTTPIGLKGELQVLNSSTVILGINTCETNCYT